MNGVTSEETEFTHLADSTILTINTYRPLSLFNGYGKPKFQKRSKSSSAWSSEIESTPEIF
jgi:hypothetical protein